MTDPASLSLAPLRRIRWRALVAIMVMVGIFFMHGMSASADASCAAQYAPSAASVQSHATAESAGTSGMRAIPTAPGATVTERCDCGGTMGTSCIPLAPRGFGGLLSALLLALAWVSVPRPGSVSGLVTRVRRARRGRLRASLLTLTCVCRT